MSGHKNKKKDLTEKIKKLEYVVLTLSEKVKNLSASLSMLNNHLYFVKAHTLALGDFFNEKEILSEETLVQKIPNIDFSFPKKTVGKVYVSLYENSSIDEEEI